MSTTTTIPIRTATLDDLDAVAEVHTLARNSYYTGWIAEAELADPARYAARRTAWGRAITSPDHTVMCALQDGHVVGIASIGLPNDEDADPRTVGQLYQIHVRPGHWCQGIGTRLHRVCVESWRAVALSTARVEVWEHNRRGRMFYAARGWQPDGHHRPGPIGSSYLRLRLAVPGR